MNKIISFILFTICCGSYAQKIDMYFPHFGGKTYDFMIFQGDKHQTLVQGTIPEDGKFTLSIPKEYAPYTGMSRWLHTWLPTRIHFSCQWFSRAMPSLLVILS